MKDEVKAKLSAAYDDANSQQPVSAQPAKAAMPAVGFICIGIGILSLLLGGFLLIGGMADSADPHVNATGEVPGGLALLLSSAFWFAVARGLALMAQIAHNTASSRFASNVHSSQQPVASEAPRKA